jgi:hypothetical protein
MQQSSFLTASVAGASLAPPTLDARAGRRTRKLHWRLASSFLRGWIRFRRRRARAPARTSQENGAINFPASNTGAQRGGWFRKEGKSVADLTGLKFRVPQFKKIGRAWRKYRDDAHLRFRVAAGLRPLPSARRVRKEEGCFEMSRFS